MVNQVATSEDEVLCYGKPVKNPLLTEIQVPFMVTFIVAAIGLFFIYNIAKDKIPFYGWLFIFAVVIWACWSFAYQITLSSNYSIRYGEDENYVKHDE